MMDAEIEGLTVKEMVHRILEVNPDLVGFSIMTPQLHSALEACVYLKQARPTMIVALGGAHISVQRTTTCSRWPTSSTCRLRRGRDDHEGGRLSPGG